MMTMVCSVCVLDGVASKPGRKLFDRPSPQFFYAALRSQIFALKGVPLFTTDKSSGTGLSLPKTVCPVYAAARTSAEQWKAREEDVPLIGCAAVGHLLGMRRRCPSRWLPGSLDGCAFLFVLCWHRSK